MKKKILWMLLSFLLVAALVLSSCAKEEVVGEQEEEEEEEEEPVGEQEEEEPAVGEPQYGGTLVIFHYSSSDPGTADTQQGWWPSQPFAAPVLDCLLVGDIDKHGPRGSGEYQFQAWDEIPVRFHKGALAESWTVTADKLTFKIRPGVYWAAYDKEHVMEPREVTAEDIAWSLNRYVRESPGFGSPGNLLTENGGWIDSIYATGNTVVIEASRFSALWLNYPISGWAHGYIPPESVAAGLDDWDNLVGTGPFMVEEYVSGSAMTYAPNPNYWDTTTIDGKEYPLPFIDKLIYSIIPDESTQIAALRTGALDIHWGLPSIYEGTLAQTSPELNVYKMLLRCPTLALNMQSEILSDRDVRRALMIAIDREAVHRATYGSVGDMNTFPQSSLVPDVWTPPEELPASVQETLVYDPVKARQMLIDAGYPDGFSLKMLLSSANLPGIDMASMVKEYWADIGVTLTLETVEATAYESFLFGLGAAVSPGVLAEVAYDCLLATDYSCEAAIDPVCGAFTPSGDNMANYYSDYFMEQYELALSTVDEAERMAILKELSVIGYDATAYIPFGSPVSLRYWWPWVKNYYGELDAGSFYLGPIIGRMWIDEDLKADLGY